MEILGSGDEICIVLLFQLERTVVSVGGGVHDDNSDRVYLHLGILDHTGNKAVEKMTEEMIQAIEFMVPWLNEQQETGGRGPAVQSVLVHCRVV
jgi:protein-tyrosine phosphatase